MARKSAEQRREEIVEIAFRHFAEGGYKGTSTEAIAREAGISQPYLFRLFRTKRELFLACVDRCFEQVERGLPRGGGRARRTRSGCRRWATPTRSGCCRTGTRCCSRCRATRSSEPEIRAHVREGYQELVRTVAELAGRRGGRHVGVLRDRDDAQRGGDARPRLDARACVRSATSGWAPTSATGASNLQATVECLWAHDVVVLVSSSVYETEPVGEVLDQRPFYNACLRVETRAGAGAAARRVQGGRAGVRAHAGRARTATSSTGRGRSTSTCCCSATRPTRPSG